MTKLTLLGTENTAATSDRPSSQDTPRARRQPKLWRSMAHRDGEASAHAFAGSDEFPFGPAPEAFAEGASTNTIKRRDALKLMSASMALAGVTSTGCVRRPDEKILPYVEQPEEVIPGVPNFYATAFPGPNGAVGLVVESHEGRPTKVEGNPDHPASRGKASRFHQASVLEIYEPERLRMPRRKEAEATWAEFDEAMKAGLADAGPDGAGLAILHDGTGGPTTARVLHELRKKLPKVRVHQWEPLHADNVDAGAAMVFGSSARVHHDLSKAKIIVSVDDDFLSSGPDQLAKAAGFAAGRSWDKIQSGSQAGTMNRLYVAEATFSSTGANADNRLRVSQHELPAFVASVASALFGKHGLKVPAWLGGDAGRATLTAALSGAKTVDGGEKFIPALAKDLAANRGKAVLLVGDNLPPEVHALAHIVNAALGAFDGERAVATLTTSIPPAPKKVEAFFASRPSPAEGGEGGEGSAAAAPAAGGDEAKAHWAFGRPNRTSSLASLKQLVGALNAGSVKALVILGTNPVYTAPRGWKVADAIGKAGFSVHVAHMPDETSAATGWVVPLAHYLEAWGDAEAWDGTVSIVQPLIKPLHQSKDGGPRSALEVLAGLAGLKGSGFELVRTTWTTDLEVVDDKAWRVALHHGVLPEKARRRLAPSALADPASAANAYDNYVATFASKQAKAAPAAVAKGLKLGASLKDVEILLRPDFSVADGRWTHNSWLMELPDSMTKLCWDNAIVVGPPLARKLGLKSSVYKNSYRADEVTVTVDGRTVTMPAFVLPGIAPQTAVVSLGYGRTQAGFIANGIGVDGYPLMGDDGATVLQGSISRTGRTIELAGTQEHFALDDWEGKSLQEQERINENLESARPILVTGTTEEYAADGKFAQQGELKAVVPGLVHPPGEVQYTREGAKPAAGRPDRPIQPFYDVFTYEGQQWGMVIDLTTCTSCHACVMACQSENNFPIVGREQVLFGREMHWIRIDRYFRGDVDDPEALHQPINCLHCENAPCEPVCPVAATVHDSEGINTMVYNRCVGTRYCANNCPVKVRRFNYFDFTKSAHLYVDAEQIERHKTLMMQRNPDVTVRFRGVIEKCSYCTQRIQEAKFKAKREGRDSKNLPDGSITPACAQTCPTNAITFGNINDEKSRVHRMKVTDRNYETLSELNIRPRTTYLARLKNPNPEIS